MGNNKLQLKSVKAGSQQMIVSIIEQFCEHLFAPMLQTPRITQKEYQCKKIKQFFFKSAKLIYNIDFNNFVFL